MIPEAAGVSPDADAGVALAEVESSCRLTLSLNVCLGRGV